MLSLSGGGGGTRAAAAAVVELAAGGMAGEDEADGGTEGRLSWDILAVNKPLLGCMRGGLTWWFLEGGRCEGWETDGVDAKADKA